MNAPEPTTRIPVLFVGGMGRSGSTLIERLIGQIDGMCNLGEVVYLADRGVRHNERCGCGDLFLDCPFWTKVGDIAFSGWSNVDVDHRDELFHRVDDVKYTPQMLLPRWTRRFNGDREEYTEFFRRLYAAAAEVSGASVIVDSSKVTSLAYALSHDPGLNLRLLHLVRDPRGVAFSWTRKVRRPEITDREEFMPQYRPSYMAALWSGHNLLLAALRLRRVPTLRLNYEQFTADPRGALASVAAFAHRPDAGLSFVGADGTSVTLAQTHSVAGNPMRFQTGTVEVRRDTRWREGMPRGAKNVVSLMTLPIARLFGYRVWRRPSYVPTTSTPGSDSDSASASGSASAFGSGPSAFDLSSTFGSLPSTAQPAYSTTADQPTAAASLPRRPFPPITRWPSVTAVVPSHGRPELLRKSIASILAQDYPGDLDVIVVHDREAEDAGLVDEFAGRVRVTTNSREPGLCGARNTGILLADSELIAFCDDDDQWRPGKIRAQVERLAASPDAVMASTAMQVDFAGTHPVRLAGLDEVSYDMLLVSRMAMLHSSSFVLRRSALLGEVGLLDEQVPGSMGEDWDLLLRAARVAPIAHVDEPLVKILWGSTSFFSRDWRSRLVANDWFLERYPDIERFPRGAGRLAGQSAFFAAASGDRRAALTHVKRSLRANVREPRAWLAVPVILAPGLGSTIMAALHRRGHGI